MELGSGKVAVVTGAGSGIGLALANALAVGGCSVVLADVQDDALERAAEQVARHGVDTLAVRTDVSDRDEVEALARATIDRFGAVHVVCNNAGVSGAGDPWLGPIEGWEWVMGVNFWGVVHGVRAFLPHLVMSGGGHIVNTASMAGLYPGFAAPYDASKHAVVAITEGLYHSLRDAQMPVGVSCLCPGWVRTGILDADRNWPAEYGAVPEVDAAAEIARTYVRRAIDEGTQPAAIADHVLDAVRDGRYWVLPHPEFVDMAMERFAQIGEGANPERPEHTPGMPPRSQVLAEVMAAMAASEDTPPTVPHDSPPTVPPA
jgi:NAD(P)-dependent dehydrogenase (short-subunit alcohol dehydrogenase family)